jgi:hypothetical protein
MDIVIGRTGQVRFIYGDELAQALAGVGEARTRRASHVEPEGGGWTADMSPVNGPKLGPFKARQEALEEEVKWLERNRIPIP